jgi:hypothetical protein
MRFLILCALLIACREKQPARPSELASASAPASAPVSSQSPAPSHAHSAMLPVTVDEALPLLTAPAGARIVESPHKGVAERIEASWCLSSSAPDAVTEPLRIALTSAGWPSLYVTAGDTRHELRARTGDLELTGFFEVGGPAFPGCDGSADTFLSLGVHKPDPHAAGGNTVGPSTIRVTSP